MNIFIHPFPCLAVRANPEYPQNILRATSPSPCMANTNAENIIWHTV